MVSTPSPPAPPDPAETASAQTATNIGTAIANQAGSQVNQVTPLGSLTYDQTDIYQFTDPLSEGAVFDIPIYTATTSYTPEGQVINDFNIETQTNLAELGAQQSGMLTGLLGAPVDLSNDEVEAAIFDTYRARMDPYFADQRSQLTAQLANQGISQGTSAYNDAMRGFYERENDAYNQAMLTGRQQAVSEEFAQRNQPINEISALLSGSQVSQPVFQPTPGFSSPTVDYAGLVNANYNQQLQAWQTQANNSGFGLGGIFSLASALI